MESGKTLGYFLAKSLRIFKTHMVSGFKDRNIELTFDQFVILQRLNSGSDIIQKDLAHDLQKDKSIIVRQIECLLAKEFVVICANSVDKRKKNLIITEKGSMVLNQMQQIGSEVTKKLLSGVGESEQEIFRNVLNQILENSDFEEETSKC